MNKMYIGILICILLAFNGLAETIPYSGDIEKGEAHAYTKIGNFFSGLFTSQPFSFANSKLNADQVNTCTLRVNIKASEIIYEGGVNSKGIPRGLGTECNVGEHIRYEVKDLNTNKFVPLFAKLWYKSSSSDFLWYADEEYTNWEIYQDKTFTSALDGVQYGF